MSSPSPGSTGSSSSSANAPQNIPIPVLAGTAEAQIVIGSVNIDDTSAKFVDDSQDGMTIWADTWCENEFSRDPHIYQMSVTSPGGFNGNSVAFVKLGTDTLIWKINFTMARWKTKPTIPAQSTNSNWVLLDREYTFAPVTTGPDGLTPLFRVSGTLWYGALNPNATNDLADMNWPLMPWLSNDFDRTAASTPTSATMANYSPQGGSSASPGSPGSSPPSAIGIAFGGGS